MTYGRKNLFLLVVPKGGVHNGEEHMAAHRQSGQETERAHHQPKYDAASI